MRFGDLRAFLSDFGAKLRTQADELLAYSNTFLL